MRTTKSRIRLAATQTDLSLCLAHISEGTFSHVAAQMFSVCVRIYVEKAENSVIVVTCVGASYNQSTKSADRA